MKSEVERVANEVRIKRGFASMDLDACPGGEKQNKNDIYRIGERK